MPGFSGRPYNHPGGGGSSEDAEARADIAALKGRVDGLTPDGVHDIQHRGHIFGQTPSGLPLDFEASLAAQGFAGDSTLVVSTMTGSEFVTVNTSASLMGALWELETDLNDIAETTGVYIFPGVIGGQVYFEIQPYGYDVSQEDELWTGFEYTPLAIFLGIYGNPAPASLTRAESVIDRHVATGAEISLSSELQRLTSMIQSVGEQVAALQGRVADLEAAAE